MQSYEFYQLDVFTETPFTGNALAVFPEAEGLSDEVMQRIAREMNLSETVFVLKSEKALRKLKIFTPMRELPLAGHPVVGAWNLLATLGVTPQIANGSVEIVHELNVGLLLVEIEFHDGKPFKVVMTQAKFETGNVVSADLEVSKLAYGLGLDVSDIGSDKDLPIQVVSTGIKALAVPVVSMSALGKCKINSSLLSEVYLSHDAIGCYAFTFETVEKTSKIHSRFFAPDDNIAEDPATGSAAGSLAGYLVNLGAVETENSSTEFTIEQGDFMNRPSRIFASVEGDIGNVRKVKIGGNSVIVAKGELFV